jgi:hypothetical protein
MQLKLFLILHLTFSFPEDVLLVESMVCFFAMDVPAKLNT